MAWRSVGAALLLWALASACGAEARPAPDTDAATAQPADAGNALRTAEVATGLATPWGLVPLADGSLLVSERDTARILRIVDGRTSTVATVAGVDPGGEGGLLGLALTPDKRTLVAYFTAASDNRIVTMAWDGSRLGEPTTILTGIPKGGRHNGGVLRIGPDGHLYVGTGETGQPELAQDRGSLGGKILRIRLDGSPAPDNPFGDAVYSYGHRNVEGLAFDDRGRLWASEFGETQWDELNLITPGANYGWPEVEGAGEVEGLTDPVAVWRTRDASPAGLAYWRGSLWMAGLRGQRLWEIPIDDQGIDKPVAHLTGRYGRLRAVQVAVDQRTLLVSTSNTDGRGAPRTGDDRIVRVRA
jgi:glucose/arabinose dehydrogenase